MVNKRSEKIKNPKKLWKKAIFTAVSGALATVLMASTAKATEVQNNSQNDVKAYISITAYDKETGETYCPSEGEFVQLMLSADVNEWYEKNFKDETRAEVIYEQCLKYNVNPLLCIAQAGVETNWGENSEFAEEKNNFWGIAASDNSFRESEEGVLNAQINATSYESFFEAVVRYAENISSKYILYTDESKNEQLDTYIYGDEEHNFEGYHAIDSTITKGSLKGMAAVYAPLWILHTEYEPQFKHGTPYSGGTYQDILDMLVATGYLSETTNNPEDEIKPQEGVAYANYYADTLTYYAERVVGKDCILKYTIEESIEESNKEECVSVEKGDTIEEENSQERIEPVEGSADGSLEAEENASIYQKESNQSKTETFSQQEITIETEGMEFDWMAFFKEIYSGTQKKDLQDITGQIKRIYDTPALLPRKPGDEHEI